MCCLCFPLCRGSSVAAVRCSTVAAFVFFHLSDLPVTPNVRVACGAAAPRSSPFRTGGTLRHRTRNLASNTESVSETTEPLGTAGRSGAKLGAWSQGSLLIGIPNINTPGTATAASMGQNAPNSHQTPPLEIDSFFMFLHCWTLHPIYC